MIFVFYIILTAVVMYVAGYKQAKDKFCINKEGVNDE